MSDGEGQFIAVMRRRGDALCKNEPTAKQKCKKGGAQIPDKQEVEAIAAAKEFMESNDYFFAAGNHEFSLYLGEAVEDADYRNQSLAKVQ